jgi:CSLREA domain-containing protein
MVGVLTCLMAVVFAPAALAMTVNTTADDATPGNGSCSLREAIVAGSAGSNSADCGAAGSAPITISVPEGTYELSAGQLAVGAGANIAVVGANRNAPALTTIDASGDSRVLEVTSGAQAKRRPARVHASRERQLLRRRRGRDWLRPERDLDQHRARLGGQPVGPGAGGQIHRHRFAAAERRYRRLHRWGQPDLRLRSGLDRARRPGVLLRHLPRCWLALDQSELWRQQPLHDLELEHPDPGRSKLAGTE